jgi:chemotaxis protein MotB
MAKKAAHHGGAWKVAYADFVTALMALFMVLWIAAQDPKILKATSRYFQQPFHSPFEDHSGIMPFNQQLRDTSSGKSDGDDSAPRAKSVKDGRQIELNFLNSVAADFKRLLRMDEDLDQKPIDVQVTSDGLLVTLFDHARQPLFKGDTSELTEWGDFVMQSLAWTIERNHFRITIDGHTRQHLALHRPGYTAWELSADRANAARRRLVYYAVDEASVERVAGYADTRPLDNTPPDSELNQRITLSLSVGAKTNARPRPDSEVPLVPDRPIVAAAVPAVGEKSLR